MEGKIYQSIISVMEDVGAIGKEKKNQTQGFMYRGIDDVMNALNPAFIKHKVFAVTQVLDQQREERTTAKGGMLIYSICKVKYTFYAEDGSNVEVITIGEGMDSGDKATNKAMAIAFKYACFQLFCIPTEEMTDPDAECHELANKQSQGKAEPQRISKKQINELLAECDRIGKSEEAICAYYKIVKFADMDQKQYQSAMKNFSVTPDKPLPQPNPDTIPPDNSDSELPFK